MQKEIAHCSPLLRTLRPVVETRKIFATSFERRSKNLISFKTVIRESQSSFKTVKYCTEISPSVPRTLAKSARESERSRCGLNFVTVPTQMQSLPGKEINNYILDDVSPELFLVTIPRSQILLCRFRVASTFTKGDKFLSK